MDEKDVKIDTVSVSDTDNTPTTAAESTSVNDAAANAATNSPKPSDSESNPETEKLNSQIAELTDKFLRLAAELENTRRRAALDIESASRNRAMSVAKKFLPVMDAIQAAQEHAPDDAGIKSMAMAMNDAFTQIGITKIESVGQILNPLLHNAIQVVDAPGNADSKPAPNTIISELQPGYMFGDTVLRTAMVTVCK